MFKSKKFKVFGIIALALLIAVMIFVNIKKNRGTSVDVVTIKVKKGEITKTVSGSGYLQPETDVQIAARISAEIIRIHVEEGDIVKKGQLLVELDRQRYIAQLEQAESQVLSAQASLKKAEADYSRVKDLFDQKLTSKAELDAAEASMLLAQSDVKIRSAYMRQAQDDLDKTRLLAPINGVVTKLFKEEGEIAVGSEFNSDPVITVSDLSKMEALVEVDENDVVLVTLNDSTKIEVDAIPDTSFDGTVSEIAHTATTRGRGTQEQVTNFEVKVAVVNQVDKLRPGMTASVDISTETHYGAIYIPIQCVTMKEIPSDSAKADSAKAEAKADSSEKKDKGNVQKKEKAELKEAVFVIKDGIARLTPVKTGISDDTYIEILSGLEEGQEVVSGSYKAISSLLKDESKVKAKEDESFAEEKKKE
ncbi:MAG TPA: efflux RND transporter periplasmic adaptor subunit [bacterium]|nr:efflux RND transporter periplasmic adaptor subunit [bacterium]HPN44445.1 efflux RND transporter periplasmic adaptor subunit [bacterium]